MPHFPKPFYRKKRGRWSVQIDGKQVNLGPDEAEAFRLYHELMADRGKRIPEPPPDPLPLDAKVSLVELLERFLDHAHKERSVETYKIYRARLKAFAKYMTGRGLDAVEAADLRPVHVLDWLATRPEWNPGMRHGVIQAVQRAYNWAVEVGLLPASPVAKMKKPPAGRREVTLSDDDFEHCLTFVPAGPFVNLLRFAWLTGCRPQEVVRLEARHFDIPERRAVLTLTESKGKKKVRVLYLPESIIPKVRELCREHPKGAVFRNTDGVAWCAGSVSQAWGRVQIRMGLRRMEELGIEVDETEVEKLSVGYAARHPGKRPAQVSHQVRKKLRYKLARKHAPKFCGYTLRHSFATNALKKNVDPVTVAVLMGHSDPSMVSKVYSHLSQDPDYLRKSIEKAVG